VNNKVKTRRATERPGSGSAPAIPFPELPDSDAVPDVLFWRAAWLRAEAQLAAIHDHAIRVFSQRRTPEPLRWALAGAENNLRTAAEKSFERLVNTGGLLYAWIPEDAAS
jgi:hypothetical protein